MNRILLYTVYNNHYYIFTLNLLNFSYAAYANVPNAFLLNVNGTLTMDENIADTGGVKEAYYAYGKYYIMYENSILLTIIFITDYYDGYSNHFSENWMRDHGTEEQKLPGFKEFSQRQMFWISYAQMYCSKWTDDGIFKLVSSVSIFVIYIVEHFKINIRNSI